jgi:hypothetical protein
MTEERSPEEARRSFADLRRRDRKRTKVAYLPDNSPIEPAEAEQLVDAFLRVCERFVGQTAAPESALPAPATRIATALASEAASADEVDGESALIIYQTAVEALIDLQAFVPDDAASAVERQLSKRSDGRDTRSDGDSRLATETLERIRTAQAAAIQWIRDDVSVVGNENALRDLVPVIGDARRALDAVDRYREVQSGAMIMLFVWPVSAGAGVIVGALLMRPTIVVMALMLATWLAAPGIGSAIGALSSRVGQAARASRRYPITVAGGVAATVISLGLLFGLGFAAALLATAAATRLGLP